MNELKPLTNVTRELDDDTRKQGIYIAGEVYSLHIANGEVIVTDNNDYTKIYSIQSIDFFKFAVFY